MPDALIWGAVSFCLGLLVGALATMAAYASRVAVLEHRATAVETALKDKAETIGQQVGRFSAELDTIKRDINGLGQVLRDSLTARIARSSEAA